MKSEHLQNFEVDIVLLTEDEANLEIARKEGLTAARTEEYVKSIKVINLSLN